MLVKPAPGYSSPKILYFLSDNITYPEVDDLFREYGQCTVFDDDNFEDGTFENAKFYIIEYEDCSDAKDALELNKSLLNGENLYVGYTKQQTLSRIYGYKLK